MDNEELRQKWRKTIEGDGGHCPVCDRWGRIYARGINKTMAQSLMWLCQATKDESGWVDVPTFAPRWLVRSNQLATLRWWTLVERRGNDDPKNKHSGMWKTTKLGLDFAGGIKKIPDKVYTYKGEVESVSQNFIHISECFKEYFDYEKIMNEYFPAAQQKLF
jgi:hypothetical protein